MIEPPVDAGGRLQLDIPWGRVDLELVLTRRVLSPADTVSLRLANHGDVAVVVSPNSRFEMWRDGEWAPALDDGSAVRTMVAQLLGPRETTAVRDWPGTGATLELAKYRVTIFARLEDPHHVHADRPVALNATFIVRGDDS